MSVRAGAKFHPIDPYRLVDVLDGALPEIVERNVELPVHLIANSS